MLSIQQLRTPLTRLQALEVVIDLMQALGFETTGWQDGRIQKTLIKMLATVIADSSEVAKDICEFGFNLFASGAALTEFSRSRYGNDRIEAVRTRGPARLLSTASIPYTIEPGQLIATTANGVEFRNVTGGTLPAGSVGLPSALVLEWECRVAGSVGNVANTQINRLVTPLAGVTITNNEAFPWYTVAGQDEEFDAALQTRNRTKWATLSLELVADAYVNIALSNGAAKVAIDDQNPRGPGTIDVYAAGASALLGDATMEALQAVFAARTFGTDPEWPSASTSRVSVLAPETFDLDLTGTIYHDASVQGADAVTRVEAALDSFLELIPLGGFTIAPGLENVITLGDLLEVIEGVEGISTAVLTAPATISVPAFALVRRGTWNLTPVAGSS